jgi:hypothetical protein
MLASVLFFTGCEVQKQGCTDPNALNYDVTADYDDGSCIPGFTPTTDDCTPDIEGNLSITNETDQVLYLYRDFAFIRCIPANTENFIVNIPNQALSVFKLQIWKADAVTDRNNPQIDNVYRQWSVALSNTTDVNERANWLITGSDSYAGSGTVELTYPELDDYGQQVIYQVDVYLNSKAGAKLASLQPGVTGKKVSVEYGVQYLYFRYWYSDPNSTSGEITEIGWSEEKDVVINAEHQTAVITVPFYYSNIGKYGELKIMNKADKIISIYANDALIETIAKVEGSSQGLSIIPANDYTTFLIPVNTYTITAKSFDGSTTYISFKGIDILQNETAIKEVGVEHRSISIKNSSSETLMLYTLDKEYLGISLTPGESSGSILIPTDTDSLMVMNGAKSKFKKFVAASSNTISSLDDYIAETFEITSTWTEIETNHYQSLPIENNSSTNMLATLVNNDPVDFSFEYKVSSEPLYDKFSFEIDGVSQLSMVSGEVDWTTFTVTLQPGTHYLQWLYTKDEMFDGGSDNVEIRNIAIE